MPKRPQITILQLYPDELNVYGDNGNLLCLKKRLEWRGIDVKVVAHNVGDNLPSNPDIIISGGGQDSNQAKIADDFVKITPQLQKWVEAGMPTLLICGSYQLFGHYFQTETGDKIPGAGILDLYTAASKQRLIGNIVVNSAKFGQIVGYENHSGQTHLGQKLRSLGVAVKGRGNNLNDGKEGVFYKNLIGTYCHGPVLPKNPAIADFLIAEALKNQGLDFKLNKLDDTLERAAAKQASNRPR